MNQKRKNKVSKRKRQKKKKLGVNWIIEEDCKDAPDPERRKIYLEAAYVRLKEYAENIKRDRSDPKWEYSSREEF